MKNIKLSDSMDNIDITQLDNIELREKMDNKISTEKIKNLVFKAIDVDRDTSGTNNMRKPANKKKLVILLAAVVLVLSTSVYALSSMGIYKLFFPEGANAIDKKTQDVNIQLKQDGLIISLEKAVNDGKTGVISYYITKADGSEFDENTVVGKIKIEAAGKSADNVWHNEKVVENNKKLVGYIMPIMTDYGIATDDLMIDIQNLVIDNSDKKVIDINLQEIVDSKKDTPIEMVPDLVPGCTLDSAEMVDGKLSLQVTNVNRSNIVDPAYIQKSVQVFYLKNIKTGEAIYPDMNYTSSIGSTNDSLVFSISKNTALTDLKPVALYTLKKIAVPRTWNISVKLENSSDLISKDVNVTISNKDKKLDITKVSASSIMVYFKAHVQELTGFNQFSLMRMISPSGYVLLRNGQKKNIRMWRYNGGTKDMYFTYTDLKNEQLDFEKITDLYISRNFEYFTFIDSSEISSVVIEGEEIPLR